VLRQSQHIAHNVRHSDFRQYHCRHFDSAPKFLPAVAEKILIENFSTKYGGWLNILCWL